MKNISFFAVTLFALMIVSTVNAASPFASDVGCRIDFNIAVLNSLIAVSPANTTGALQTSVDSLTADKALADSSNTTGFKAQFAADMMKARSAAAKWRATVQKDLNQTIREGLATSYQNSLATFQQCTFDAQKQMAQQRISDYQTKLTNYQSIVDKLGAKGFDTTELSGLIQGAQTQIIQPLQSAVNDANDSSSLATAMKKYCLFTGCPGKNFHMEAKFDVAKYSIILAALENSTFNLSAKDIDDAHVNLNSAKATLTTVDTTSYSPGQAISLFSHIKVAAMDIARLIKQTETGV